MAFLNPRFQDAGGVPGEAAHWILNTQVSGQRFAGFGPDPVRAVEDFARWSAFLPDLEAVTVVLAFFSAKPQGFEDFERGWGNDNYPLELSGGASEACSFGGSEVEDFDLGWSMAPIPNWEEVVAVQGLFGGNASSETFGAAWLDLVVLWSLVPSLAATFDGNASAESFTGTWPKATTI